MQAGGPERMDDQNKNLEQVHRDEEQELAVETQQLTQLTTRLSRELSHNDTVRLRAQVASSSSLKLIEQAVPYMERSDNQITQVKSLVTAIFDWLACEVPARTANRASDEGDEATAVPNRPS